MAASKGTPWPFLLAGEQTAWLQIIDGNGTRDDPFIAGSHEEVIETVRAVRDLTRSVEALVENQEGYAQDYQAMTKTMVGLKDELANLAREIEPIVEIRRETRKFRNRAIGGVLGTGGVAGAGYAIWEWVQQTATKLAP